MQEIMKKKKRRSVIKLPAVIAAMLAVMFLPACVQVRERACKGGSGEFQPDANTLFLAHYNTGLDADYSQGGAKYERMDTGYLTGKNDGYFGEGLVGRVGKQALQESGARMEQTGLFPAKTFDGLRYPSPGNLDLERGTFECWIKPYFSIKRAEKMPAAWPMIYVLFAYTETAGKGFSVCFNQDSSGAIYPHFFITGGRKDYVDIAGGKIDWQTGAWHHVAVTWDNTPKPGKGALFLDGKKAAEKSFAPLEGGFPRQSAQFPCFCIGCNLWRKSGNEFQFFKIDAVVDEVRISNIARYREDFVPGSSPNH